MERSLKIAKEQGVEALEKEVRARQRRPIPCNVSPQELTAIARMRAKEELMFVATAMATTLTDYIKMPPSLILDYLVYFNHLMDVYRMDPEQYKKDQEKLDRNAAVNETTKRFMKKED